jgi:thioredoxin
MSNLTKITSIIAIALLYIGCSGTSFKQSGEKTTDSSDKNKSPKMVHLTKESFKQKVFDYEKNKEWKYAGKLPCIIDFYADWCGPCKMVPPTLEELSKEYEGKIEIYKVDTDAENELAEFFDIRSIPTFWFCPLKGEPKMASGAMSKDSFREMINEILLQSETSTSK